MIWKVVTDDLNVILMNAIVKIIVKVIIQSWNFFIFHKRIKDLFCDFTYSWIQFIQLTVPPLSHNAQKLNQMGLVYYTKKWSIVHWNSNIYKLFNGTKNLIEKILMWLLKNKLKNKEWNNFRKLNHFIITMKPYIFCYIKIFTATIFILWQYLLLYLIYSINHTHMYYSISYHPLFSNSEKIEMSNKFLLVSKTKQSHLKYFYFLLILS